MCFDEQELLAILAELIRELHHRKKLFASAGLPNIDQYNAETGADLRRLIFACDEVAEVLDRTGLSKEQKELVNQIESRLATIARLGCCGRSRSPVRWWWGARCLPRTMRKKSAPTSTPGTPRRAWTWPGR